MGEARIITAGLLSSIFVAIALYLIWQECVENREAIEVLKLRLDHLEKESLRNHPVIEVRNETL